MGFDAPILRRMALLRTYTVLYCVRVDTIPFPYCSVQYCVSTAVSLRRFLSYQTNEGTQCYHDASKYESP
jgi:hypothetical protein